MGPRALCGRLQRRLGRGARVQSDRPRHRHRHGRLAAHPLGRVRDIDGQADARARPAARHRPASPTFDHAGPMARTCATASRCSRRSPASTRRPRGGPPPLRRSRRGSPNSTRTSPMGLSARSRLFRASVSTLRPRRLAWMSSASSSTSCSPRCSRTTAASTPLGRVSLIEPRPARARRAAGDDGGGVHREPERAGGGHGRLARLVRGAPDRCRRRAHHPDRRAPPRPRLRGAVRRSRRPFAHVLLGLDGVPGRHASRRCRWRSGLPTSVSLIGRPGAEWDLLSWGEALQDKLGTVSP